MATRVNIKKGLPYDIYMGRANKWLGLECSKWHNPEPLKNETDRSNNIIRFREYALSRIDLHDQLEELDGKICGCYCPPEKKCHVDIWLELLTLKKLGML